jgi:hypothetical protein
VVGLGTAFPFQEIKLDGNIEIHAGEIGNIKETEYLLCAYGDEPETGSHSYSGISVIIQ